MSGSKRKASSGEGSRRRRKVTRVLRHNDHAESSSPSSIRGGASVQPQIHRSYTSALTRTGVSVLTTTVLTTGSSTESPGLTFPAEDEMADSQGNVDLGDCLEEDDTVDPHYKWHIHSQDVEQSKPRKRYASDDPLRQWLPHRQEFLDEFMRLEGRGDRLHHQLCSACGASNATFRCRTCFGDDLACAQCMVLQDRASPLHRIEEWNGDFFARKSLQQLGLRISLHSGGQTCMQRIPAAKGFVILDIDSVQEVTIDYCGCPTAPRPAIQLLRMQLYPATLSKPSTAATFRVMEAYHISTLQSKQSAFDYYHTLERLTDNAELHAPPDRYEEFLRMARQWRHLKLLKRSGRGHIDDGVATTQPGDLALRCPACPQPGVNLPDDWEEWPEGEQWLFNLIVAIDANFRLRRRNISSHEADPPLGSGWAYFVAHIPYRTHLEQYHDQKEASTCSNHAAIGHANVKTQKGLSVTGVGACVCARHGLIRPQGVVDLQRGERYCNMDYVFFSTMRGEKIKSLVASYDISCQWYKNLWTRMHAMPPEFVLDLSRVLVRFVIPKFHLPAHVPVCHAPFSLNYALGVGRTDGEVIERDWSMINPVSYSTREMTPGHRADTLDDHWGDWNWRKVTGMGTALARKIKSAVPELITQSGSFRAMCDALPAARVEEWCRVVEAWERESTVKEPREVKAENPYTFNVAEVTQVEVRLDLARADAAAAASGNVTMQECTPSEFIITGLELQEQQLRLREARGSLMDGTPPQQATLQQRRNVLQRKLEAWQSIQVVYMPGVQLLRAEENIPLHNRDRHFGEAEEWQLFLPLELQIGFNGGPGMAALCSIEARLCEAQAHDALREIRHHLRLLAFSRNYKKDNCRGQRESTRAGTLIKRAEEKKHAWVRRYQVAWHALQTLNPSGPWTSTLRVLKDVDVRALEDPVGNEGEGRRVISWIWAVPGVGGGCEAGDIGLHDSLRVEWCKSRARSMRWREEIRLVREEMRRVEQWLAWRSKGWRDAKWARGGDVSLELREGLLAHASRQAWLYDEMREVYVNLWADAQAFVAAEVGEAEGPKKID